MELLMEKPLQGRMCTILSAVIIAIFLPASTGSEGMTWDSSSEPRTNNKNISHSIQIPGKWWDAQSSLIYNQAHPLKHTNHESLYTWCFAKKNNMFPFFNSDWSNVTFLNKSTTKNEPKPAVGFVLRHQVASRYDLRVPSVHGLQIYYLVGA